MNWPLFIGLFAAAVAALALVEAALDWYGKWEAKRHVDKLMADALAGRLPLDQEPRDATHRITCDAAGFSVSPLSRWSRQPARTVRWDEVHRVVAFKRDLWGYDEIAFAFERADDTALELDEDMIGWNALTKALPAHLPGCKKFEEWFSVVAFPAFMPNTTLLFQRGVVQPAPVSIAA